MRALLSSAAVAALIVGAAFAGWRSARPRLPSPAPIVLHEALEAQRHAVAERNARRLAQADFERSLPSRVTLLRRELTEPGLRVSRVASVGQTSNERLFYINGEVARQGSYAWSDGMLVREAIQRAGGALERADVGRVTARRAIDGNVRRIALALDDPIRADDVISVPQRPY